MRKILPQEIKDEILKLYPHDYSSNIAKKFGVGVNTVYNLAFINKVKKSDEFHKMEMGRQAERLKIVGVKTRIKKGTIPPNKGYKMPEYIYEKVKVSFFTKGSIPYNTKFDGYERIDSKDGYVYVRISKGKFVLKHRWLWEQHNGKIPAGYIIKFINGDRYDIRIDNLKMVTRQENMETNRVTKYPKEIQQIIKLNNKLKKKINEKQN